MLLVLTGSLQASVIKCVRCRPLAISRPALAARRRVPGHLLTATSPRGQKERSKLGTYGPISAHGARRGRVAALGQGRSAGRCGRGSSRRGDGARRGRGEGLALGVAGPREVAVRPALSAQRSDPGTAGDEPAQRACLGVRGPNSLSCFGVFASASRPRSGSSRQDTEGGGGLGAGAETGSGRRARGLDADARSASHAWPGRGESRRGPSMIAPRWRGLDEPAAVTGSRSAEAC